MCLLLAIIHSTFPKVLYWVGMHFLFTDGKTDRKRWSGLPGINSLVCCLFKALGTAFFTWAGGSLLERHWAGLKAALWPLVLLAGGEQAEESPQLAAASLAAFSDGRGNNPKGPDFQFCVLSSDPNWLWDDWFYVQGWISCHHLICIPWEPVSSLTPHWVFLVKTVVLVCRGRAAITFLCTSMGWEGWIFTLMGGRRFHYF